MRLSVVCDLVAYSRLKREGSSICQFGLELSFRAEKDMALHAPVISKVSTRVLDHSNSDGVEVTGPPAGLACLSWMLGSWDQGPVCCSERNAMHLHRVLSLGQRAFRLAGVGPFWLSLFGTLCQGSLP